MGLRYGLRPTSARNHGKWPGRPEHQGRYRKYSGVEFLVDCMAGGRIDQGNAFIQKCLELSPQIIGQILASTIGTGGVGLIPVVCIMDIFQPASGHDRDLVGALGSQVRRPRQTEDFD